MYKELQVKAWLSHRLVPFHNCISRTSGALSAVLQGYPRLLLLAGHKVRLEAETASS